MLSKTRAQIGTVWRLATPYFQSQEKATASLGPFGPLLVKEGWVGRGLLLAIILAECGQVYLAVVLNQWNARFYNSLENKDPDTFWREILVFSAIAAAFIVNSVYQLYLNQWLQIRWRRWMTLHLLDGWLEGGTHYRMRLAGDGADNPDQRIAEDTAMFVERTLSLGVGLFSAITTLASFSVILWGLSTQVPLAAFGLSFAVPGHLVWIAAGFALVGTIGAHVIGRHLIGLNFDQQRLAADFRFGLVRVREHSEQIALLGGETAERGLLSARFASIVGNWQAIMSRQKSLTFFTSGYNQIAVIIPYLIMARPFFAGTVPLGSVIQTAGAFAQVQASFSYLVNAYARLAEWLAVVDRLSGFAEQTRLAHASAADSGVEIASGWPEVPLRLVDVHVAKPCGTPLLQGANFAVEAGKTLLLTGSSGCGKTTLLRAMRGFWPFAKGRVLLAPGTHLLVLPQRPYLPLGSLRAALAYPADEHAINDAELRAALDNVGLTHLAASLDRSTQWSDVLSLGEQQRIGFARVLLTKADVLLLDEATSALDETSEAALYRMLRAELPTAAIVSVGHRSTLVALHHRSVDLAPSMAMRQLA